MLEVVLSILISCVQGCVCVTEWGGTMTEIESYSNSVRWEPGQGDEEFDAGNNSSKLFERSRIKALAGEYHFIVDPQF